MGFGQNPALVSDAAMGCARARPDKPFKGQFRHAMRDKRGRARISDSDLAERQDAEAFVFETGCNIVARSNGVAALAIRHRRLAP